MFAPMHQLLCSPTSAAPTRRHWPWEAQVARAWALREVCRIDPARRGVEVVGALTDMLASAAPPPTWDASTSPGHTDDSVAAAEAPDVVAMVTVLALDGLGDLCGSGVVDAQSAWHRVGPSPVLARAGVLGTVPNTSVPRKAFAWSRTAATPTGAVPAVLRAAVCRFLGKMRTSRVDNWTAESTTAAVAVDLAEETFPPTRADAVAYLCLHARRNTEPSSMVGSHMAHDA